MKGRNQYTNFGALIENQGKQVVFQKPLVGDYSGSFYGTRKLKW